jgi:hypothetical protein
LYSQNFSWKCLEDREWGVFKLAFRTSNSPPQKCRNFMNATLALQGFD